VDRWIWLRPLVKCVVRGSYVNGSNQPESSAKVAKSAAVPGSSPGSVQPQSSQGFLTPGRPPQKRSEKPQAANRQSSEKPLSAKVAGQPRMTPAVSGQPAGSKPSPIAGKRSKRRWMWIGLALTGVATLSATAGALLAVSLASTPLMQRKLSADEAAIFAKGDRIAGNNSLQVPELTRPVNILVMGIKVLTADLDAPPSNLAKLPYQAEVNTAFNGLSDTMLLLRFDPESKRLVVMSIPRDTRVEVGDRGIQKINAANDIGGPALAAKTTSQLLGGVGVDRYITLNAQGVRELVDALGGVTVYIPKDMKYQDDSQHLYINLKAGKQRLNGNQAMNLLRFRHDQNGDIGRIQRQQMVMRALMEQSLNPATVARLPKILKVIQSYVDTNVSVEELVALVGFASKVSRSNVQMLMVPGDFSSPGEYDASYWLPDYNRIPAMVAQYFNVGTDTAEKSPAPANLRVAIQDSTKQVTATQALLTKLQSGGLPNVGLDEPYGEPLKVTRIVAQQGDVESARAVRQILGFGEIRVESTGELRSDVTVQVGQDWVQRHVKTAALKSAKPTDEASQ
jgi:polyisoprenyl-teichoic acid--peptidoglycan teichoic acid transferase